MYIFFPYLSCLELNPKDQSRALSYLRQQILTGTSVSFASAAAIAMGRYTLPVYEIFSAGIDLHWLEGLNFFSNWGLNLTIIPHWNNTEGGRDIDTRYSYMGEKRFNQLLQILPDPTTLLGIDEQTACILDFNSQTGKVMGIGTISIKTTQHDIRFESGQTFAFSQLES